MTITVEESKYKTDQLIKWLRDFANRRVNSMLMDERRMISPHIVLEFGNRGLFGMAAPIQYGGLELQFTDVLRIIQQIAAIDPSIGAMLGIHNALVVNIITKVGTDKQKLKYLSTLTSGRQLGCFALTEEGMGSHYKLMCTKAVKQADGSWLLHGSKKWIGLASWSGMMIVLANEIDEMGNSKGISCFLVSSDAPGVVFGDESLTMGVRSIIQNTIHFEGAFIDKGGLLGNSGFGLEVARNSFHMGRLFVSIASVGIMKRASQIALRYAYKRKISTGILLNNVNFRETFYRNCQMTFALDCFIKLVCHQIDKNTPLHYDTCSLLKLICPELAWQVVDYSMQMLGSRGYTETNVLPQLMRDVRLFRIFEGATETLGDSLGKTYIRELNIVHDLLVNNRHLS